MNDNLKMTISEAFSRIDQNAKRFSSYAIDHANGANFVKAVKGACEIYLSLDDPVKIKREINNLAKAIHSRPMDVPKILTQISPGAQELIYNYGGLPSNNTFTVHKISAEALQKLKAAITFSEKIQQDTGRKTVRTIVKTKMGRPGNIREAILVSYLATAFAIATDRPSGRSWSNSDDALPNFERLVEDVLVALLIDDQYSHKTLVRHHIEERERLSAPDNKPLTTKS